ncbi:MAG: ORF6N domain-containing protein [Sulfurimonas sp.]|uniref:ORF6N domain-containing protein n=1 Tax=Sulfurimonas sp. TaxID=2022749 RepID=UPI002615A88F|nr:ORF6N domain-containing protein [Sulfurimonas sp.]MDD5373207.1 ORF6N domain-containing protein [Sulfurimonas sp.]
MDTKNQVLNNIVVDDKIFIIRGIQVMIDKDLAELYKVQTSRLNEQVKRNIERFDGDFMFQLTKEEFDNLISQNATSSWGGVRKLPYVFTEQGVYMLATVLKSGIAVEVTKQIMRTFTKLKNQSVPYFDIIKRLEKLETNDKETTELLQKVVQVVSSMQSIYDEAREGTKKIGFV